LLIRSISTIKRRRQTMADKAILEVNGKKN
jgi:hypothetical protein